MKPAPFDYFAPASQEETLSLLGRYGAEAKILAGGQSLVPLLNFRMAAPQVLIDINRVEGLSYIRPSDHGLVIGSLTRHRAVETSPEVKVGWPILSHAARFIGHLAIRNRGTFGGSLAHADPAAELPVILSLLGARMQIKGPRGERSVEAKDFFVSYLTTVLQPDELLTETFIPPLPANTGWSFQELTLLEGAFALVAAGALVTLDQKGACKEARITLGGVAPTPVRAEEAEKLLRGERATPELLAEAAGLAARACDPTTDIQASAEYRIAMAGVFVRRTLTEAWQRGEKRQ